MRVWALAHGETAGRSPTTGAMGMDCAWARHQRRGYLQLHCAKNPLVRERLLPVVNDVEQGYHGNACTDDVRESARLDENVHGDACHNQSHPGPKARWILYVHTQETVDHTLLRVAVCGTTVVSDSMCM